LFAFFMDDTDLCMTLAAKDKIPVQQKMQEAVMNWEGLLKVTGGALVPEKCFLYSIQF